MGRIKHAANVTQTVGKKGLYTLHVFLAQGPITKAFSKKKKGAVSRTIAIRGDQTLADLHETIFHAYDRDDEHMYEFQFGKRFNDANGSRYVLSVCMDEDYMGGPRIAGDVDRTTIASLKLQVGTSFGYWFDFGDNWYHQINVISIDENIPRGKYPKIVERVGESPPQYPDFEDGEDSEGDEGDDDVIRRAAADLTS